jgi:hypothetical protein
MYLAGPSRSGNLRLKGTWLGSTAPLSSPPSSPTPIVADPDNISAITLPGGGTVPIAQITPITPVASTSEITSRRATTDAYGWKNFFRSLSPSRAFAAPHGAVINVWIGHNPILVYSQTFLPASFETSVPIDFFTSVPLYETAQVSPPPIMPSVGGGTTYGGDFGDFFGSMFMEINEGGIGPTSPITSPPVTPTGLANPIKLDRGYHPVYIEVVTPENRWNVSASIDYDYISDSKVTDPPIIKDVLLNKVMSGMAHISWNTNVLCDRNWVTFGVNNSGENSVQASRDSQYPYANLTLQDGTSYYMKVFSQANGRTSNTDDFNWKMPGESIAKTGDTTPQGNTETGITGDGTVVTTIQSEQELSGRRGSSDMALPLILAGGAGVILLGIGGVIWYFVRQKKG